MRLDIHQLTKMTLKKGLSISTRGFVMQGYFKNNENNFYTKYLIFSRDMKEENKMIKS